MWDASKWNYSGDVRSRMLILRGIRSLQPGYFKLGMTENDICEELELQFFDLGRYLKEVDVGRDPKTREKQKPQWVGHKDFKLDAQAKDNYEHWDIHDDDVYELAATTVQSGYKLSFTFNSGNDTFNAALTGDGGEGKNYTYTMSAFAPDWYNALRLVLFKHHVLLDGDWGKINGTSGDKWG